MVFIDPLCRNTVPRTHSVGAPARELKSCAQHHCLQLVTAPLIGSTWPRPLYSPPITSCRTDDVGHYAGKLCRIISPLADSVKAMRIFTAEQFIGSIFQLYFTTTDLYHEFQETCHSVTFYCMKKDSKRCCDTTTPESTHTKDESKRGSAFAFIFGVN